MPAYKPALGDRVTIGGGETIWTISSIGYKGDEVNLHIPGSNLERFRVRVSDLVPVELTPRTKPTLAPKKPRIDAESINEALIVAQHESVQHLSAIILSLKEQLAANGAPPKSIAVLDKLCLTVDGAWDAALGSIMKMVEP